jgi:hypothetical protein
LFIQCFEFFFFFHTFDSGEKQWIATLTGGNAQKKKLYKSERALHEKSSVQKQLQIEFNNLL